MNRVHAALPVLLACLLSVHLGATVRSSDVAKFCCFQFSNKVIPRKLVHAFEFTQSSCSQQAVIFITKRGRKICANPKKPWVQTYLASLKGQQQL
ncbi:C-C motif chemokine 26 [Sorex araneus]|uniref:C-C motif chemokine 26 n=1 Tax=Sorex araneus TaxID=42254 RepID=UPI002433E578|nr:C-C motif chemokine 26 [Sorex araneus]